MYKDLPFKVKKEIRRLLKANQFPKAKELHDAWIREQAWQHAGE